MNHTKDKTGKYWWITVPDCSHFDGLTVMGPVTKVPRDQLTNEIYFDSEDDAKAFCRKLAQFIASQLSQLPEPPCWLGKFKRNFDL